MTTLYAVFQEGVYRHACCGIFDSRDAAIACAKHFANIDRDSYHNYEVVPFNLNQNTEVNKHGYILENPSVFKCNKDNIEGIIQPNEVGAPTLSVSMASKMTPEMIEKFKQAHNDIL